MGLSGCCGGASSSSNLHSLPQGVVTSLMNGEMALPHTDKFPLPSPLSCPGGCQEAFYCRFGVFNFCYFLHVLNYVCCFSLICCSQYDIVDHAQRQIGQVLILYSALVRGLNQYLETLLESLLNILMVNISNLCWL